MCLILVPDGVPKIYWNFVQNSIRTSELTHLLPQIVSLEKLKLMTTSMKLWTAILDLYSITKKGISCRNMQPWQYVCATKDRKGGKFKEWVEKRA